MTRWPISAAVLAACLSLLAVACDNRIQATPDPLAAAASGEPQLRLELLDLWEPVGERAEARVFRYGPAPDVELWVKVASEDALTARSTPALADAFAKRLRERIDVEVGQRATRAGDPLFSFSALREEGGRRLFTHNWVLVHHDGATVARADLSLRLPAMWAEQPATGQLVRQVDELLYVATFQ